MSALSHPGFRAYFIAAVPLTQARWAQRVTLGWLAWQVSGSAPFVGLIAALGLAPLIFAGPVFGVLVDRAEIRRALLFTSGTMCVLLAVTAMLAAAGLGRATLVAVALMTGFVTAAHDPVRMSLAPRLVPKADVPNVIALTALNFNMARMIAPVLTGLALATFGPVATLWISSILYMPMLLATRWMHPRPLPADQGRTSVREGIAEGLRYVATHPVAREAMVLTGAIALLVRAYLELLPVMAEGVHDRGAEGLGVLTAAAGFGALVAAVAKAAGAGQGGIAPITRLTLVLGVLAVALVGLSEDWWVTLGWTAVLGFASTFSGVGLQAAVQEELPDALRGRVMSLWAVVGIGAVAFGSGLLGWGAGFFGLPRVLLVAGLLGAAATGWLALSSRGGRAT
ncbi:MFS transporter [uncultured Jannaschia sp.]|uniref:MFS transporter n=1 Tax=uncultured Jannaschia sp. TaxID=293347 RepID=UPI002612B11C|nr:MFS transporter [uncultured Jannaschia sp.]